MREARILEDRWKNYFGLYLAWPSRRMCWNLPAFPSGDSKYTPIGSNRVQQGPKGRKIIEQHNIFDNIECLGRFLVEYGEFLTTSCKNVTNRDYNVKPLLLYCTI